MRNASCMVSDGLGGGEEAVVEEEHCAGLEPSADGDERIALTEACTLPCPGM